MKVILLLAFLLSVFHEGEIENAHIYADCGIIMEEPTDVVTITMQNGNMFEFENEDEWMTGDIVSVIFYDNATKKVEDDIILYYRYSGWSETENWIK